MVDAPAHPFLHASKSNPSFAPSMVSQHPNLSPPPSTSQVVPTTTCSPLLPDLSIASTPPTTIDGEPAFLLTPIELSRAEAPFAYTLVAKFSSTGHPPLKAIKSHINSSSWGLSKPAVIGPLDHHHVMIHLSNHEDMVKAWTREDSHSHLIIENYSLFRLFRWSPSFDPKIESSFAAVWIQLPYLPLHFFHNSILKGLVSSIGKFLRADDLTCTLEYPMYARVCIEMDISKNPLPSRVWVGTSKEKGFWQKILYEGNISYCSICSLQGHSVSDCRKNPHFTRFNKSVEPENPPHFTASVRPSIPYNILREAKDQEVHDHGHHPQCEPTSVGEMPAIEDIRPSNPSNFQDSLSKKTLVACSTRKNTATTSLIKEQTGAQETLSKLTHGLKRRYQLRNPKEDGRKKLCAQPKSSIVVELDEEIASEGAKSVEPENPHFTASVRPSSPYSLREAMDQEVPDHGHHPQCEPISVEMPAIEDIRPSNPERRCKGKKIGGKITKTSGISFPSSVAKRTRSTCNAKPDCLAKEKGMIKETVGKRTKPKASREELTKEFDSQQTAERPVTEKERNRAIHAAQLFKTEKPSSFMVIMKHSYLKKGLNVPLAFAKEQFKKGSHMVKLSLPIGKTWHARFFLSSIKALLSGGWNAFARENILREGDCCVFEVFKEKEIEMKVTIFHVVDDWVPLVGSVPAKTRVPMLYKDTKAAEAARKFKSRHPFYKVYMHQSYAQNFCMIVKPDFVRKHLPDDIETVTLQSSDRRKWPVKCSIKHDVGRFGAGWTEFAKKNNIEEGDVCAFELIKKMGTVLKVTIFKNH